MSMEMSWMLPRGRGAKPAFLKEWEENAQKVAKYPPYAMGPVGDVAVKVISCTENLKLAWDYAARHGGQAAGPNGKTFSDFSRVGVWSEIERLHDELMAGLTADLIAAKSPEQADELRRNAYRHGAVREARVPKRPGSTGKRPLAVPNVQDRVVGRAEAQILEPLFRPRFDDRSFCRPGRGPWQALAHAQLIAEQEDRWIWIAEDVVGAFDHVPLSQLLEVIYSYIPSDTLLDLIRRSIGEDRRTGLWQGAPLSPLLMEAYLGAMVDRHWRQLHPDVPLLRFMDDMLLLCSQSDDAELLHRELKGLVEAASLNVKYDYPAARHAVERNQVTWLGYRLRRGSGGELEIKLPFDGNHQDTSTWKAYLRDRFKLLHRQPQAPEAVFHMIHGIIARAGPTLPWTDSRAAYDTMRLAARAAKFEELPSQEAVCRRWALSHEAWQRCCQLAAHSTAPDIPPTDKQLTWDAYNPPWDEGSVSPGKASRSQKQYGVD